MAPEKLQQLRRVRAEEEAIPLHPYTSLEQIRLELSYVDELCRKLEWQRIDATGKSVEEVAREIIESSAGDVGKEIVMPTPTSDRYGETSCRLWCWI